MALSIGSSLSAQRVSTARSAAVTPRVSAPAPAPTCRCLACTAAASGSAGGSGSTATRGAAAAATYTDTIKKTGNRNIDALLAGGNRWFHTAGADGSVPSAVARTTLTYSFIDSAAGLNSTDANGFVALDSGQREVVRRALGQISQVVGVQFSEVSSGGDIQYGSNSQASSAGYARYPNEGSQVFLARNQSSFEGDWAEGSYTWQVILHETGHALGLKHPGNYNAGGGGTAGPYLPKALDHRGNTLMSYYNASNMKRIAYENGAFQSSQVNADTMQAFDIAALQYLYGAPASQATTYRWREGQALSQTIYNNNPDSRIDLSNQTLGNVVDLRAGNKSSIAVRDAYADMPFTRGEYAKLSSGGRKLTALLGTPTYTGQNNLTLATGSRINGATGGSGNDTFIGNSERNTLDGGAGNDRFFVGQADATVTGGAGDDTVFLARRKGHSWSLSADGATATLTRSGSSSAVATVSLEGIESVRLWDGKALKAVGKALSAGGTAGTLRATA